LKSALEQEVDSGAQEIIVAGGSENLEERQDDGIVTTEEEIEGFHIVRAILHETTDPERITLKDRKSYCNVLLDDNVRKPVCRFYFDSKQKYLEEKVPMDKLSDIYKYADKLKATIDYYGGNASSKVLPETSV